MVAAPAACVSLMSPWQERRAAELAAPDHQRVVEQAALLQVLHQRGRRGWSVSLALDLELRGQVAVLVPAGVHELHEAHAALDQPPGHQAVVGERCPAASRPGRTSRARLCGSLREVGQLRHARLHPVRHLVLAMRVAISGSPNSASFMLVELARGRRACRGGPRGSCRRGSTGTAPGRRCRGTSRPGTSLGRKPLPQ